MVRDRTERDYRARVARAVAAIIGNPIADLHLDDLARLAHFSPFHFHRVYAGVVGETVTATLRRVRLALATRLLTSSDDSVTQVALTIGYDSPQAFTRAFHQFTGQSPRAFRQQMRRAILTVDGAFVDDDEATPTVKIVERPAQRLHALRHVGSFATIPHTHRQLRLRAGTRAISEKWGASFGNPRYADRFSYYAAIASPDPWPEGSEVETLELPGGRYVVLRLVGPYTRINAAAQAIYRRWMPDSGYEPDDRPTLEHYLDTSSRGIAPAALRTDLFIPIRNASAP
ncbi:AraC family transcriptional regulator [Bosea vaviloviae]|uniref:AraC family transcriptional regulator n=1 Tax=Bosea vaviloviae TaxID=1526658 RepID=A0A1D7TZZ4_9HYPH|nr:GyrI-like domain-containing protein [Bosea vaviloviae]AOO80683.1 AraC family transcriptional regulator [Bosea vaviloviae]